MTGNEEARATDGDLVSAPNTPSRFTARVASTSSTGLPEPNLVWKDTVLVRACESSTDYSMSTAPRAGWLTDTSPEHIVGGMMFSFDVLQREPEVIR
jgi:hypothetical protein